MAEKNDNTQTTNRKPKSRWKKLGKWCGIVLGIVLILLLILLLVLSLRLERILEKAIPPLGSTLMGTKVELAGVRCSLLQGSFRIQGLKIANPPGFQNPTAIEIEDFKVKVDLASLGTDVVTVDYVKVSGLRLDYEYRLSGSNLDQLLKNLQKKEAAENAQSEKTRTQNASKDSAAESSTKVQIKRIESTDNKISVSSSTIQTSISLILPPLTLTNVGDQDSTLTENVLIVFQKLLTAVVRTIDWNKVGDLAAKTGTGLLDATIHVGSQVGDAGQSAVGAIGDAGKSTADAIGDAGKSAADAIGSAVKGLFK